MNLEHLHLLLNHFPTIGTLVALGLFIGALLRNHDTTKRIALAIFFLIAIISMPTYMSGAAAQLKLEAADDTLKPMIAAHADAALVAFIIMTITGVLAWFALWQYRRKGKFGKGIIPAVLVTSLLSFFFMAQAANIGGEIRHPEIRTGAANTAWLSAKGIGTWVTGTPWAWPASEAIHFIGLCMLFGIVVIVNLRFVGIIKRVSFSALHRMLPLGVVGFLINTFTGMLFFLGTPEQYTENVAFYWKVVLMVLAGVNVLYFTMFDEPWSMGPDDVVPRNAKVAAVTAIILWIGVMYMGRMLPYIGNSF